MPLTQYSIYVLKGLFPNAHRATSVIALFRIGDIDTPGNFRLISRIPIFGKLFEILMKKDWNNTLRKTICLIPVNLN